MDLQKERAPEMVTTKMNIKTFLILKISLKGNLFKLKVTNYHGACNIYIRRSGMYGNSSAKAGRRELELYYCKVLTTSGCRGVPLGRGP